ncbi:MAG: 1-acyl-sn-glycerol-3-phosphate acyltransferase [Rhodobacteraceae bacterium]|nr:1-acyl-sn-glycerol-3-phosphate acyltransferase [Paracoccaceae bacterium]
MRWILSLLHLVQAYAMMLVMGIVFLPWALVSKRGAWAACHAWARYAMWTARIMVGIKTEVRGEPPTGEVLVAAKHQSFLDIMMIYSVIPWGKFIMKNELVYTPIIGVYAWRLGCVPVKRGRRADAIKKMLADVKKGAANPGQLCIYPQGTRVPPRVEKPYKAGTYALYRELGQPCVPVATNAGVFWPKKGLMRYPGTAIVEFLPEIPVGHDQETFMTELEKRIETGSDKLLDEAGA